MLIWLEQRLRAIERYRRNGYSVGHHLDVFIIVDRLDGTFNRIVGQVASHPGNDPEARYTFTIKSGGKTIFERANMKGDAPPQLIAVDVPGSCDWVVFDFKADDDTAASKSAKGIWKNVEFKAE